MDTWFRGLVAAVIGGIGTAGGTWVSLVTANAVGLAVPTLNLKALGVLVVVGAATNLFSYLKQSPLPAKRVQTSTTITKDVIKKDDLL